MLFAIKLVRVIKEVKGQIGRKLFEMLLNMTLQIIFFVDNISLFPNYTGKKPDAVNFWLGESAAVTSCTYCMAL